MFILNIRQMMPAIYLGKELCLEFVYPRPEVRADFLLNIADTTKNRQRASLGKRTAHYEWLILSSSECGDNQIELCFGKNWLDSQRTV
jgi:hypothetical protein